MSIFRCRKVVAQEQRKPMIQNRKPTRTVDTVIVGGGIAGVSLAFYLSSLGLSDIILLEGNDLASGCTGGSMGGVRQQFSTPVEIEIAVRGRRFWQTFEHVFDYPCPYYQDGYLLLTGREDIYAKLCEATAMQHQLGATSAQMLGADDLRAVAPWLSPNGLLGGCWTPEDGRANPTDGVYGLAAAARRNGVTIKTHSQVESIERGLDGWVVQAGEPVVARRVVVAAGLGTPFLMRHFGLDLDIRPWLIHSALTTPVASGQEMPVTIDLDSGLIIEREQDAAVISILNAELGDRYSVNDMLEEFADIVSVRAPVFGDVSIRNTYSAYADLTGDGHPYIGQVEPDLWVMAGFDGHGTMQGPPIAELTARLIAGAPDPTIGIEAFDPRRTITTSTEWMSANRK